MRGSGVRVPASASRFRPGSARCGRPRGAESPA
jgi:hypothetical protein